MPYFSIVVPCYNAVAHIDATIQSVIDQTFQDWELILVDDGSTDGTSALLHCWRHRDTRIKVIRLENGGPARARNIGVLEIAQGDVIAFLDSDDLWSKARLAELYHVFRRADAPAAAFNRVGFFRDQPQKLDAFSTVPMDPVQALDFLAENPVCTMSNLAVQMAAFQKTGGFNERMVHNEDMEWLIRLAASGATIQGINRLMTYYRVSVTGLSANLTSMHQGWRDAVATAERLGLAPSQAYLARAEAIQMRYLARRALRTCAPGMAALKLALLALRASPSGFFDTPRRGLATLAGALIAPVLPRRLHQQLFS